MQEFAGLEGHHTEAQHEPQSLQRLSVRVVGNLSYTLYKDLIPKFLPLQAMANDALDGGDLLLWLQLPSAVLTQVLWGTRTQTMRQLSRQVCIKERL